jgi:hypothetical protein
MFIFLLRVGFLDLKETWSNSEKQKKKEEALMNAKRASHSAGYIFLQNTKDYKRSAKLNWLNEQVGSRMTGYDLCLFLRTWLETNGYKHLSICEVILTDERFRDLRGFISIANVFLSHTQNQDFLRTIKTIYPSWIFDAHVPNVDGPVYFWVDYFCLRQCQPDFEPNAIVRLIAEIGAFSGAIDDLKNGYFSRSFCILEVYAAIVSEAKLKLPTGIEFADFPHKPSPPVQAHREFIERCIKSADATTRDSADKKLIDAFICENIAGGFDALDAIIIKTLQDGVVIKEY